MNYTILVTGPPYGTQNSTSAFLFSNAVIVSQHTLNHVFFYCDGVLNASKFVYPSVDECNLVNKWEALYKKHSVKLRVCISAALRRGIIDEVSNLKGKKNINQGNVKSSFILVGLSEFSEYLEISDRIIQF